MTDDKADGKARRRNAPWAYVVAVQDVDRSARYYCEVLGFQGERTDDATWRLVQRDGVTVMLAQTRDVPLPPASPDSSWFGYLRVADIDALHLAFLASGALILQPPTDRPHGPREMIVATPDGHRILFSQDEN
jgi:predicted enzyme related to lactoylglutathione lyase